jgi:PAS domain S-box-containing protein
LVLTEKEVQTLQNRVIDLERQLAEAQTAIKASSLPGQKQPEANTAQQKAEELNAIIQTLHDPVMVYDQNGVISLANTSAVRAHGFDPTGYHRRETNQTLMVRYPDGRIVHPDELPSTRALKGETVVDEALTITNSHGQELSLLVTSSPLIVNGIQKGAVSVWHDITERKHTEEALRKSEAKYRSLVETAFEGVWVVDTEGHTTFINHRMAEMLKYDSPNDLMDRSAFDFVPPEDLEQLKAKFRVRLNTKSPEQYDVRLQCRDGSIIWASAASNSVLDDHGSVVGRMALFMDITDRKRFETALLKRESILAQAGEIAHLGAWDIEFQNQDDVNANPLNWSDEVYCIFGYAPGEIKPSNELFFERVHPDDRARVQENIAQAIATRQPYIIEHRVCRPDGEERVVQEHAEVFFDETGKPLRIVGAVQDITERKRAEEALRESEERFRFLADSMPQLVWTALPNGTVDYYNSRYLEYQEIKQVKVADWEWAPVLHPDDLQPTTNAWQHSLETGEIYQIEHRVRMADGSYRWHLSRGVPVLDEKGQIIRWFGTATDIHDTKLAEEQLKIYTERLERSNHELEQFAFMASHDLQEPLRKIEVFGDLLLESSASLHGRERNYLDRMRDAAGRMRDMVDGLLQLSRVTTQGKPFVQVSLSQVIEDVLYDLENQIRRTGGRVNVENLPAIDGDPLQLRQLMQNLIGNALKYHQPDVQPEVKVHAKQLAGNVQILVEDNGIGFEQADAERIFQPFQRLVGRSQYEGSGMGLAICRRIAERHGGEITAHSKPGHGSTFIVSMPMYQTKGTRKEPNNEDTTSTSGRGR